MPRPTAQRYAAWLDANRVGILVLSALITVLGGFLAMQLHVRSDLTSLLPGSKRSVTDLHALQERARPFGTVHVVIESDQPGLRARAGKSLVMRLRGLDTALAVDVSADDGPLNRYAWQHRFLFAPLADLKDARDALATRIEKARLAANPLYVPLDDDDAAPDRDRMADLEAKLADLEHKAADPPPRASKDGKLQLIAVQTAFGASDTARGRRLVDAIRRAIADTRREVGPSVKFGLTGNVPTALEEHDSVLSGMWLSVTITVVLCAIGLIWYYRSKRVVLAMLWALTSGVAAMFAFAWATIGHLNVMTAFLTAIVVGNGINAGMILVARYQEQLRAGEDPTAALAPAIAGALRGTLAATATAAIAYTSLLITDFRGFRQFGAIAGAGMVLTWIATFTVLPALLFVLARHRPPRVPRPPALGQALARLLPRAHFGRVIAGGAAITLVAAVVTTFYIVRDPFTRDWRDLQSTTPAIRAGRALDAKLRAAFDPGALMSGQAYQVVIALERRDQVAPVVAAIKAADAKRPPQKRWTADVRSLEDLLPADQPAKLAVLAEIRKLIDDPKLTQALSDDERAKLAKVRPPETLRPIGDADVPRELAWPFIEKNGAIGRLIVVRGARRFDSFDVDDRLEFAREVRWLALPDRAVIASESLIVADIMRTMEADAPGMIAFALAGSILAVVFVVGLRRHGVVTIVCGMAGVIVMIAACAAVGLPVHFLDLVALPITIGIGIDYAVNLAARDRQEGERGPQHLLATTGGTVLLCSYTTTIGYGTLLLSANGGIRAFGLAALLGEISCIAMALIGAPTLLAVLRERARRKIGDPS